MKKLLALLLLPPFILVSCSPKQYSFECRDGIYKVVIDDLRENITVKDNITTYKIIVPLSQTYKYDNGDLVYNFNYEGIANHFSFRTRDNSLNLNGLRCKEV